MGGVGGIVFGILGIYAARRRFPGFRQVSLPLNASLVTAATSFSGTQVARLSAEEGYTPSSQKIPLLFAVQTLP